MSIHNQNHITRTITRTTIVDDSVLHAHICSVSSERRNVAMEQ
jgi:hypothetical protein